MQASLNKEIVRRFVDEYQTGGDEGGVRGAAPPGRRRPQPAARDRRRAPRACASSSTASAPGCRTSAATILHLVAEGNLVITHKVFHGTHTGEFMGIPPTGREVEILVIDLVRVEDGRIVEHWNVVDRLGLLQQPGAIPAPETAATA